LYQVGGQKGNIGGNRAGQCSKSFQTFFLPFEQRVKKNRGSPPGGGKKRQKRVGLTICRERKVEGGTTKKNDGRFTRHKRVKELEPINQGENPYELEVNTWTGGSTGENRKGFMGAVKIFKSETGDWEFKKGSLGEKGGAAHLKEQKTDQIPMQ